MNFIELGEGMSSYRGFHSSFRAIQGYLPLNTGKFLRLENADVSTKVVIKPDPVLNFLVQNQKAKRILKNLRIRISPFNMECKITSDDPCTE
ncbi:hypothetical protein ACE6H2_006542 [Prunus campanulata]